MALIPYLVWSFASALFGGLSAAALNKWAGGWSLTARFLVAMAASILPTAAIVGSYMVALGAIPLWTSLEDFLIPFALQIFLIVVVSAPIVWLVLRRGVRNAVATDVFD